MTNGFRQDLRYGLRMLWKSPAFTALAVATMALGIGANTAMFSFLDAVLLKPLGYQNAEQLVTLWETRPRCPRCFPSPIAYLEWKEHNTSFSHVTAYTPYTRNFNLTGSVEAEQIVTRLVSADYFDMLEVRAHVGRTFAEGEDKFGNERVAILSHRFWQRKFNGDPQVIGSTIVLDENPYTVVGVLPPGGIFDRMENELWLPLAIRPDQMRRNTQFFGVRARLKPGVTIEQANDDMARLIASLNEKGIGPGAGAGVLIEPLRKSLVQTDLPRLLALLMGAVAFVLLIAAVNVANLLLARSATRRREIVIRLAVGAQRWQILRQLLTESVLLACAGGAAGVLVAHWLIEGFSALVPKATLPVEAVIGVDLRVLGFTAAITLAAGIACGLLPAWQATRIDLRGQLQESGQAGAGGRSRYLLLVFEIALTFVLVTGATLLLGSFRRLVSVDPGFVAERVLTFRSMLSKSRYPGPQDVARYESEMLSRIKALPGVSGAALTNSLPLSGGGTGNDFQIPGRPEDGSHRGNARVRTISPDYFATIGIRLIGGREFGDVDTFNSEPVAIVNQALARRYWPERMPTGERIEISGVGAYTIVGVVSETRHNGLSADSPLEIYVPIVQLNERSLDPFGRSLSFVVRTTSEPGALAGAIREVAMSVDRNQPLFAIQTMEEIVSSSVAEPRFRALLFALFGLLAVALAAIGVYGVISYTVAQSTREIGIRIALGASPRDVARLFVRRGLGLAIAGVALGAAGSAVLGRFIESLLFGTSARDPLTYLTVAAVLAAMALAACYLPARRASRVDPLIALRYE